MGEWPGVKFIEWLGGAVLAVIGWAIHRYTAIHRKMDAISEDVAVMKAQIEHVDDRLNHMEKRWDSRRKSDRISVDIVTPTSE